MFKKKFLLSVLILLYTTFLYAENSPLDFCKKLAQDYSKDKNVLDINSLAILRQCISEEIKKRLAEEGPKTVSPFYFPQPSEPKD